MVNVWKFVFLSQAIGGDLSDEELHFTFESPSWIHVWILAGLEAIV